jgi:hypothetical protein
MIHIRQKLVTLIIGSGQLGWLFGRGEGAQLAKLTIGPRWSDVAMELRRVGTGQPAIISCTGSERPGSDTTKVVQLWVQGIPSRQLLLADYA